MKDTKEAILAVTEKMIRDGGYNSFSFRNIADAVGIKSSSVHYHFASKEDLGVAVTQYYTHKFMAALGCAKDLSAQGLNPLESYIAVFRRTLIADKKICLCGVLGAETDVLPESVVYEVKSFFQTNIKWLSEAYQVLGESRLAQPRAIQALSLLEGAMITSQVMGDISVFDSATAGLVN
jgi:TetR/AcrR family transcriptional repressor of nem operon